MGISDEDLDMISDEMSSMFGQLEGPEGEEDEVDSQTATFPFMNQLFGNLPKMQKQTGKTEHAEKEHKKETPYEASLFYASVQMYWRIPSCGTADGRPPWSGWPCSQSPPPPVTTL